MTGACVPTDGAGRRIAQFGVLLGVSLAAGACDGVPGGSPEDARDDRRRRGPVERRIMYCDDGSRADVAFLARGPGMGVTWLPGGTTVFLRARRTGDEYHGSGLRAVMAGDSIAFMRAEKALRICHRTPEKT